MHLLHVPSPLHLGVVMLLVSHCALFMQATQASATQMGLSAAAVHWPEVRQGTQAPLAAAFVRSLGEGVPGFRDEQTHGDLRLPFSSKATLRARKDSRFISVSDQVRVKARDRLSVVKYAATQAAVPTPAGEAASEEKKA